MDHKRPERRIERRPEDSPAAWFVELERARLTDNRALADRAIRELARLGVQVNFTKSESGVAGAR